jgi:hypothetical protein
VSTNQTKRRVGQSPPLAESPETLDSLERTIRYLEATLSELTKECSEHYADLSKRADVELAKAAERAAVMMDKLSKAQGAIISLETLVYGEPKYLLLGLTRQFEDVRLKIDEMQAERLALKNKIEGMRLLLAVLGVTGASTLLAVVLPLLADLFG